MKQPYNCYLYVIEVVSEGRRGPTKVGISANPWSRANEMQTGCPYRLNVAHAFLMPNRESALWEEKFFHDCHSDRRIHREWFDLSPLIAIEFIADTLSYDAWEILKDAPLFQYALLERLGVNSACKILECA